MELYADSPTDEDVLVGVGQQPRLHVAPEYLNLVAVMTAA